MSRSPTEARRRLPKIFSLSILDSPFGTGEPEPARLESSLAGVAGRLWLCRPKLPKLNMLLLVPGEYRTSFLKGLWTPGAEGGRPLIDLRFDSRISAELGGLGIGTKPVLSSFSWGKGVSDGRAWGRGLSYAGSSAFLVVVVSGIGEGGVSVSSSEAPASFSSAPSVETDGWR